MGGETGPGARPMHPDIPRSVRGQCAATGVPFLFKGHGEWREYNQPDEDPSIVRMHEFNEPSEVEHVLRGAEGSVAFVARDGRRWESLDGIIEDLPVRAVERVGRKRAGRELDGVTHDAAPPGFEVR